MKLRPYQEKALDELLQAYDTQDNACVVSPTGSGKTVIIQKFVEEINKRFPDKRVCVTTHRLEILKNLRETLDGLDCEFETVQKLYRSSEEKYDVLVLDECLDGDTEILTDKGFVKFSEYESGTPVAQWNYNGTIEFVEPKRFVKQFHKQAIEVEFKKDLTLFMSPHHRQPYIQDDRLKIQYAKNIYTHGLANATVPLIEHVNKYSNGLDAYEKLMILCSLSAYTMDKGTHLYCTFSLRNSYKINRLTELLNANRITYNIRTVTRGETVISFNLKGIHSVPKLQNMFPMGTLTYQECVDIIEEVTRWKYRSEKPLDIDSTLFHITSSDKAFIDYLHVVGIMGGYDSQLHKAREYEHVEETFYKLRLRTHKKKKADSYVRFKQRNQVEYNDYMYCVEVPSSFFVVKRENYVFVTGNCHHVVSKSYRKIIDKNCVWHCGFTATPLRGYMPEVPDFVPIYTYTWKFELSGLVNDDLYTKFILTTSTKNLIQQGYLSDYELIHDYDFHIQHMGSNNRDYTKAEVDNAITVEECVDYVNATLEDRQGIVFCHSIEFAEKVTEGLKDKAVLITSKTKKAERLEFFERFRQGEIQLMVNVDIFSEGVDVPAVDCVYLFRPTRSIPVYFQQIGRALRLAEGKTKAIIYDYVNNRKRLGVEPKDVELEDMLLTGKFIKESCEYCENYGIIEGSRDKVIGSVPSPFIRKFTRFMRRNINRYECVFSKDRRTMSVKLLDTARLSWEDMLFYMLELENQTFKSYNMAIIRNPYGKWELATTRNASQAVVRKNGYCLLMQGKCKYSDTPHPYYVILDNLNSEIKKHIAKIKK